MALEKCPRCELNYVKPGEKYCTICMRDLKGIGDANSHLEICPICGENPVQPGKELCSQCMQDHRSLSLDKSDLDEPIDFLDDDPIVVMEDMVPVDLDDRDAPADEIEEIKRVFSDDEAEPDEEDPDDEPLP